VRNLEVKNFSCIDYADLEIGDLTVIIGPQASGKSVICKLFYFFNGVFDQLPQWSMDSNTPEKIKIRIIEEFCDWFQPTAWGGKSFSLSYSAGDFKISISRGRSKSMSGRAKIHLSDNMENLLAQIVLLHDRALNKKGKNSALEEPWRTYSVVRRLVNKSLAENFDEQLYIPAGRSFFTSVGKIVTAFEDRSMLDPVVTRFGRLITSLREDSIYSGRLPDTPLLRAIETLIDGKIVNERGKQSLSTSDGRSIPFSALSSGQQELLPLLSALQFSMMFRTHNSSLLYIEEPEAHLFPSAQTQLIEMFSQIVNSSRNLSLKQPPTRIVITTHSPYVLAKMNNLIKAGVLSKKLNPEKRRRLEKIIPQNSWIQPYAAKAYAIHERRLISIIDNSGLIDGDYIDKVSELTGSEFERMLDMEMSV